MTDHPLVWIDARKKQIHAPANMSFEAMFNHVLSILSELEYMPVEVPFEFPEEHAFAAKITAETRPLREGWSIVQ